MNPQSPCSFKVLDVERGISRKSVPLAILHPANFNFCGAVDDTARDLIDDIDRRNPALGTHFYSSQRLVERGGAAKVGVSALYSLSAASDCVGLGAIHLVECRQCARARRAETRVRIATGNIPLRQACGLRFMWTPKMEPHFSFGREVT